MTKKKKKWGFAFILYEKLKEFVFAGLVWNVEQITKLFMD